MAKEQWIHEPINSLALCYKKFAIKPNRACSLIDTKCHSHMGDAESNPIAHSFPDYGNLWGGITRHLGVVFSVAGVTPPQNRRNARRAILHKKPILATSLSIWEITIPERSPWLSVQHPCPLLCLLVAQTTLHLMKSQSILLAFPDGMKYFSQLQVLAL